MIASMVRSTPASAWRCGVCLRVHAVKAEADVCCTCSDCGGKFEKGSTFQTTCDGCAWGSRVRSARADIRRTKQMVADYERRLAELLKEKPQKASKLYPGPHANDGEHGDDISDGVTTGTVRP